MNQSLPRIFMVLLLFFSVGYMTAQNNYVLLKDPGGMAPGTEELSTLNSLADSIIESIPAPYKTQFKVFEGGIYPLLEHSETGVSDSWTKLKAQAGNSSTYYLLLVRHYDKNGKLRWYSDYKLPEVDSFECLNDVMKMNISASLMGILKNNTGESPRTARIAVLEYFRAVIDKIIHCDCEGLRDELQCNATIDLGAELVGLGFRKQAITLGRVYTPSSSDNIIDLVGREIALGGATASIPERIRINKRIIDPGNTGKVYILNDSEMSMTAWDNARNEILNETNLYTEVWFILEDPFTAEVSLYSRYFITSEMLPDLVPSAIQDDIQTRNEEGEFKFIIHGFKNGAFDLLCQMLINYHTYVDTIYQGVSTGLVPNLMTNSCLIPWNTDGATESMNILGLYNGDGVSAIKEIINILSEENFTNPSTKEKFRTVEKKLGFYNLQPYLKALCIGNNDIGHDVFVSPDGDAIKLDPGVKPYAFYGNIQQDFGGYYGQLLAFKIDGVQFQARFEVIGGHFIGYYNIKLEESKSYKILKDRKDATLIEIKTGCEVWQYPAEVEGTRVSTKLIYILTECDECFNSIKDGSGKTSIAPNKAASVSAYFNQHGQKNYRFIKKTNKSVKIYYADDCAKVIKTQKTSDSNGSGTAHEGAQQTALNDEFENKTFTEKMAIKICIGTDGKPTYKVKIKPTRHSKVSQGLQDSITAELDNEIQALSNLGRYLAEI